MMSSITTFQINRKNFGDTQFVEKSLPELEAGEVLLKVDRFAFTANNITYAVLGDRFDYWKFFPADKDYGIIPVWGFGEVITSNNPAIAEGQRFYGYYPMSSHLVVKPEEVLEHGFKEGSSHRKGLPAIYNFYMASPKEKSVKQEAIEALYRPLFTTSFLLDTFLASSQFFMASQIILTSASSKTAYGLALLLAERKKASGANISIVGLTSSRNVDFVEQLGFYDQVIPYEQFNTLAVSPSTIIDFSGNHRLQYVLQHHLGDQVVYNSLVGMVDWTRMHGKEMLPREGEVFFAPDHYRQQVEKLGATKLQEQIADAWKQLNDHLSGWLEVAEQSGQDAIRNTYIATLKGETVPAKGNILRF